MFPAQPPLPSWRYLPFHAAGRGSHNANLISESVVGRMTPLTSQCAGSTGGGGGGGAVGAPWAPCPCWGRAAGGGPWPACRGGVNGPSATVDAEVMVVFPIVVPFRLSHEDDAGGCCAARARANPRD